MRRVCVVVVVGVGGRAGQHYRIPFSVLRILCAWRPIRLLNPDPPTYLLWQDPGTPWQRVQVLRALVSEKLSLQGTAEVLKEWAGRLKSGAPVAELYSDWDWGFDGDEGWGEGEEGEEGEEEEEEQAPKGRGGRKGK